MEDKKKIRTTDKLYKISKKFNYASIASIVLALLFVMINMHVNEPLITQIASVIAIVFMIMALLLDLIYFVLKRIVHNRRKKEDQNNQTGKVKNKWFSNLFF